MFAFIVKWVGVLMVVMMVGSCTAVLFPGGFAVGGFGISWSALAAGITLYFGFQLSVK